MVGKRSVAEVYAKLLYSIDILDVNETRMISASDLASEGPEAVHRLMQAMVDAAPPMAQTAGVLVITEPYQLTSLQETPAGRQALEALLQGMERSTGKIIVVFVGCQEEVAGFLCQNSKLQRRICCSINFADLEEGELLRIAGTALTQKYGGRMRVEGGIDGQYMQVAVRRLARGRRERGFANAYAAEDLLASVAHRHAQRLAEMPDSTLDEDEYFFLSKEDLLGPSPCQIKTRSEAWVLLEQLVGQEKAKASISEVIDTAEENYWREVRNQRPLSLRPNRIFAGPPGTGKTTMARLYAQILADLGVLETGEVVLLTPSGLQCSTDDDIVTSTRRKTLIIDEGALTADRDDASQKIEALYADMCSTTTQGASNNRCVVLVGSDNGIETLSRQPSRAFSGLFAPKHIVRFEGFTRPQLADIMRKKLQEQDLFVTAEAMQTAMDTLETTRMRQNFDNARAVDGLLTSANRNFEVRTARGGSPTTMQSDRMLEPVDVAADAPETSVSVRQALQDVVADCIIAELERYQKEIKISWLIGRNPAERVPFAMVFKGPHGTGKADVARQLARIYYDMGILVSDELVECLGTDLLGQRAGDTSSKARTLLDRAVGKVLLVEEAHRMADGEVGPEALDELAQLLPKYAQRAVVILTGPSQELDQLLSNRHSLSSVFQEEVAFKNRTPRECLRLLDRRLQEEKIGGNREFLRDPQCPDYVEFTRAFQMLMLYPCWGNARDIHVLARWMVSEALKGVDVDGGQLVAVDYEPVDAQQEALIQSRSPSFSQSQRSPSFSLSQRSLSFTPQRSRSFSQPIPPSQLPPSQLPPSQLPPQPGTGSHRSQGSQPSQEPIPESIHERIEPEQQDQDQPAALVQPEADADSDPGPEPSKTIRQDGLHLTADQAMCSMIKMFNVKRERLKLSQDLKAKSVPRMLSQPRAVSRGSVRFPY